MGYGSGITVSCGVGRRYGSDPSLLWFWHRLEATALIPPQAWEIPYAQKKKKKKKKKKRKGGQRKMAEKIESNSEERGYKYDIKKAEPS